MEGEGELVYRTVLFFGTFGMLFLASTIIVFIYLYQRKLIKKKIAFEEIENLLKQQELKSAYALLEGQDIERKRIADELHDNLGSILVTLTMYADTALSAKDQNKKNELMARIRDIGMQASEETRKLSHRLDSATFSHFGLKTALKDLFQTINDTGAITVNGGISFDNEIENEVALNLYRIIQELLNNTMKHARATSITIDLSKIKEEYISLIYEDNGIGFDTQKISAGMGLKNIRTRVENMSGDISIESNAKGVSFIIEIPLL